MPGYRETINSHYGATDLSVRILERLHIAGKTPETLTRDDLARFDEFHTGGRDSTRELARLAALKPGMNVLDIGSGVGGPARTLAAEFGCVVIGLDLTEEFCRAAAMLSDLVGLGKHVSFQTGDALSMPFGDEDFDAVWSQNTIMNIRDKHLLFSHIHRVLRKGGTFAFEAVFAGSSNTIHLPTFWASSPDLNFLLTADETRDLLTSAGFSVTFWEDTTGHTLNQALQRTTPDPTHLGRSVIVTNDLELKIRNSIRNATEGNTTTARGVCIRVDR